MNAVKTVAKKHILCNRYGWKFVYTSINDDIVIVTRSFKGMPVGDEEMLREDARVHYATRLRQGFENPNAGF